MGKGKEKKSEWILDEDSNQFYRVKKDSKGKAKYEWADKPRTPVPPDVSDVTSQFDAATLQDDYYEQSYEGRQHPNYTFDQTYGQTHADAYAQAYGDTYGDTYGETYGDVYGETLDDLAGAEEDQEQQSSGKGKEPAKSTRSARAGHSATENPAADQSYAEDAAIYDEEYGEDYDDDDDDDAYALHEDEEIGAIDAFMGAPSTAHFYGHSDEHSEAGDYGESHAKFTIFHSREFKRGRIIKLHWAEPKGGPSLASIASCTEGTYNGRAYETIRRFIIMSEATNTGSSICLPILTYRKQGCTKKGVKKNVHGIIYDGRNNPVSVPGEGKLGIDPIRTIMYQDTETLLGASRVNYSKICTIEHNTAVYFVGEVHPDDWAIAKKAYKKIWDKANRDRKRTRRPPDRKDDKRRDDKGGGDRHGSSHKHK